MGGRRLYAVVATAAVMVSLMAVPAVAFPDNHIDFIRGAGSDTTWQMMETLDRAFNNSIGCPTTANVAANRTTDGLTSNPDQSCTPNNIPSNQRGPENWDHDVAITFNPVGSGNGITTLTDYGLVDACGGSATVAYPQSGTCAYLNMEYARSSRARKSSDNPGLRFVAYAQDGITWGAFFNGSFTRDTSTGKNGCALGGTCVTVNEANGPAAGVCGFSANTSPAGACNGADTNHTAPNLTQQDIKDIWQNCTLFNSSPARLPKWSDYGGSHASQPDDYIVVWADQAGSGTRNTFDGFLASSGGNSTTCIPAKYKDGTLTNGERVIFENDPTPIRNCSTYAGGSCADGSANQVNPGGTTGSTPEPNLGFNTDLSSIYPMSFGIYTASVVDPIFGQKAEGIDIGNIDGIAPSVVTIQATSGTIFPFKRSVYNVYRNSFSGNNITPAALDYIGEQGWICKGSATGSTFAGSSTPLPDIVQSGDTDNRGGHITDPTTGKNYSEEIHASSQSTAENWNAGDPGFDGLMITSGFIPFPYGPTGVVAGNSHCRVS